MEDENYYTASKLLKLFGSTITSKTLTIASEENRIPEYTRIGKGHGRRAWKVKDLPKIGEKYGFLQKPAEPTVMTFFTTKGGVLKTTLALNFARIAALHNIKTCVVGLDMQCDISTAIGLGINEDEFDNLKEGIEQFSSIRGLSELALKDPPSVESLIQKTDIPSLNIIPETPELVSLERRISLQETRREEWLNDKVIEPLKEKYDLIILDCPPSWNMLITNALISTDFLISPIECKINNFRNHQAFTDFLNEFKKKAKVNFDQICVPSRYSASRKLSNEIRLEYSRTVETCSASVIRESVSGEDSMALSLSILEYAPNTAAADEMRQLVIEVWQKVLNKKGVVEKVNSRKTSSKHLEKALSA